MPRNESGQLEPGTLLAGRYRVERFLAGGGMGLVYIANDQRLAERRCAIKEIFDRFTNPEERTRAIEYFHREADTLAQLHRDRGSFGEFLAIEAPGPALHVSCEMEFNGASGRYLIFVGFCRPQIGIGEIAPAVAVETRARFGQTIFW